MAVAEPDRVGSDMDNCERQRLCRVLIGRDDESRFSNLSFAAWSDLVSLAEQERVAPLLCYALDRQGALSSIPPVLRHRLERARFATAAANLLSFHELCRILDRFRSELGEASPAVDGLHSRPEAVVLKGADLATTLYPSLSLRPMCDLDLLISRRHFSVAVEILRGLGYERASPELAPGHDALTGHAVTLLGGPRRCVAVELHWGLVASDQDRRRPELEWFWQECEPWRRAELKPNFGHDPDRWKVTLPGSFYHLRPTAQLLYLAVHLMLQHAGDSSRLVWCYDLHLLVTRHGDRVDWHSALEKARDFGWTGPLHAALEATRAFFETQVPEIVVSRLALEAEKDGRWRYVQSTSDPRRGPRVWSEMLSLSPEARWRFARNHVFPGSKYIEWRYRPRPRWLWPLFYPYRWGVLISAGLGMIGRWAAGSLWEGKGGHVLDPENPRMRG